MKYFSQLKMFYSRRFRFSAQLSVIIFLSVIPLLEVHANHAERGDFSISKMVSGFVAGQALQMVNEVMNMLIGAVALFFGTAASLLVTAIEFGFKPLNSVKAIVPIWTIFRDIANVFFIFILLLIAIATILRLESYGIKRLLPTLIIVALLINFSLLTTQYIIYPANWLSEDIAKSMAPAGVELENKIAGAFQLNTLVASVNRPPAAWWGTGVIGSMAAGCGIGFWFFGVGCVIGSGAGALSHFIVSSIVNTNSGFEKEMKIFAYLAGVLAVIGFATFTLIAGAIMVIARTAVLILLMVVSPLAFLAHAVPGAQGYARKWWSALISQSLFLPVYLLFIYLAISVADVVTAGVKREGGNPNILENPQLLYFYFLPIILFIAGLMFAKQMGAHGASLAIRYGQKGYRAAGGYAGNLSKRTFVGRPARAIKESRIAQTIASRFPRTLGKAYQVAEKGAKAGGLGKSEENQMALLKSLDAQHRPQTLANMTMRAQDLALESLPARDIADLRSRSTGTANQAVVDAAIARMSPVKRESVEDESAKGTMRNATDVSDLINRFNALTAGGQQALIRSEGDLTKAIDRLAPNIDRLATDFLTMPENLQRVYIQGASKDKIQALAKEYDRRGGAQGVDFATRVNRLASGRNSDVFAVLPGYTINTALGANTVPYRDMVPRMDMAKTSAAHITGNAHLMQAITQFSGMKQIREIRDRNDAVTVEYDKKMQAMWTAAGKNADALAAQFDAVGNHALALLIKTNEEARKYIGLT